VYLRDVTAEIATQNPVGNLDCQKKTTALIQKLWTETGHRHHKHDQRHLFLYLQEFLA
jgi:hypothetical protein